VILLDINPQVLDSAELLTKAGYLAKGYVLDVTDAEMVSKCFKEIVNENGPVYVLVNSAGIMEISPFEETTPQLWKRVLDINLLGTVYCIQGVIASMREQCCGKIINFASKAGKTGSKLMTVYGASKGGIITLTQALAQEYAAYGININCICPDIIDDSGVWAQANKMYSKNLHMSPGEVKKLYESKVPLGHFATKEDITDIVCFYTISGNDCTGQSINVTGGRFMH
jgi:2-hydroxycyclohexanecarboxyl-CoA dehydrogenase